ncbi:hypothetical protein [Microbacterium radiodurans]|uniref:Uncharacterized protein n=1 Tax=Microbacterium radiodurans TaxID=661398 RepID=A0A5J5IN32_9MICO|nr:hypothetical protein [Microbacterium radiodurans]KAA9084119.1 hypothetical protein F6B42_14135 [Microbacterium radiodurans]
MGTNRRYAESIDQRMPDPAAQTLMRIPPCTIPMQAYGPQDLTWAKERPPVWAWISWPHKPAERVAAVAHGWNDRVVIVSWMGPAGEVNTVVWRNAVTRRRG